VICQRILRDVRHYLTECQMCISYMGRGLLNTTQKYFSDSSVQKLLDNKIKFLSLHVYLDPLLHLTPYTLTIIWKLEAIGLSRAYDSAEVAL
jgi:hypothetical protein